MNCASCGRTLPPTALFCTRCGYKTVDTSLGHIGKQAKDIFYDQEERLENSREIKGERQRTTVDLEESFWVQILNALGLGEEKRSRLLAGLVSISVLVIGIRLALLAAAWLSSLVTPHLPQKLFILQGARWLIAGLVVWVWVVLHTKNLANWLRFLKLPPFSIVPERWEGLRYSMPLAILFVVLILSLVLRLFYGASVDPYILEAITG